MSKPVFNPIQDTNRESFALQILAFSFLTFIFLTATEIFTRFGVGTLPWILIYAGTFIFILHDQKKVILLLKHSWPVFLLSFFALTSAFWSFDPARTIYASIQLMITTVIAIWIAARFPPQLLFRSLLIATAIGVLGSILNDFISFLPYPVSEEGTPIITSGLFNQKNVYGKAIDLLVLSLIVVGIRINRPAIFLLLCILLLTPLLKTESVGSILIYSITILLPFVWYLSKATKSLITLVFVFITLLLSSIFIALLLDLNLIDKLLGSMGKDSTLTGRTWIWSVGLDISSQYPYTGVGYQAFWQPGLFEEVQLIRTTFHGQPINGFHSAYIEALVALGIGGLFIFISLLFATTYRSVKWFLKEPTIESLGVLFMVVSTIIAAMFDVIVFRQHEVFYILIIVAYAMAKKQVLTSTDN